MRKRGNDQAPLLALRLLSAATLCTVFPLSSLSLVGEILAVSTSWASTCEGRFLPGIVDKKLLRRPEKAKNLLFLPRCRVTLAPGEPMLAECKSWTNRCRGIQLAPTAVVESTLSPFFRTRHLVNRGSVPYGARIARGTVFHLVVEDPVNRQDLRPVRGRLEGRRQDRDAPKIDAFLAGVPPPNGRNYSANC